MSIFKSKSKCDGCDVKLNEEDHAIVRFSVTEQETGEKKTGELYLCPKCMSNIDEICRQEILSGRAQADESF